MMYGGGLSTIEPGPPVPGGGVPGAPDGLAHGAAGASGDGSGPGAGPGVVAAPALAAAGVAAAGSLDASGRAGMRADALGCERTRLGTACAAGLEIQWLWRSTPSNRSDATTTESERCAGGR